MEQYSLVDDIAILSSTPKRVDCIYTDYINDLTLACTPLLMHGIHLLTKKSLRIFNECNGAISSEGIIRSTEYDADFVIGAIKALWRARLITIDGELLKIKRRPIPQRFDVWFHITNNCNFNCSYCYIHKSNEGMDYNVACKAIDNLALSALRYNVAKIKIKFSGGEPLLRFDFIKQIVGYAHQWEDRGVKFSFLILTNGSLISQEIIEYLQKENIAISLSLDGVNLWNDKVRFFKGGKGSFQQIKKAVRLLRDYGIHPHIMTTVTALNLPGLPDLTQYLLEDDLSFRFSLYRGIDVSEESLKIYNNNAIEILHKCYDICEDNLPERDFSDIHQLCDIKLMKSRRRPCGIGTQGASIGHRGGISLCQVLLDQPVSHIDEKDVFSAVRDQKQLSIKEIDIDDYDNCGGCIWRYICAGGCPVLTRSQYKKFNTSSPYCDVFKACIPRLVRIMGMQVVQRYKQTAKN